MGGKEVEAGIASSPVWRCSLTVDPLKKLSSPNRKRSATRRVVSKSSTPGKTAVSASPAVPPPAEPDWRAAIEKQASRAGFPEVARYLQDNLGQRVTAYLSGITDAKMVGQWALGKVKPSSLPGHRLRAAYQATQYLVEAYGPETAQAWFFGTNSHLDSRAPAYVLRYGETPESWDEVILAVRAFVEDVP